MIEIFIIILFLLVISQGAAAIYMAHIIDGIIKMQKNSAEHTRYLVDGINKNHIDIAKAINSGSRFATKYTRRDNVQSNGDLE